MDSILMHVDLNDGLTVTKKMLKNYPMQYIGLIGLDGKPKVKAFEFKFEEKGVLYFDTIKNKETHLELLNNPYVEICVADANTYDWIRICGRVEFVDDLHIKQRLFKSINSLIIILIKRFHFTNFKTNTRRIQKISQKSH